MLIDLPPIRYDVTDVFDEDLFFDNHDEHNTTPLRPSDRLSHFCAPAGDGNKGDVPPGKRPDSLPFGVGTDTDTDIDASLCPQSRRSPQSSPTDAYSLPKYYGPIHDLDALSYNYASSSASESELEPELTTDSGMESDGVFYYGSAGGRRERRRRWNGGGGWKPPV